jgi:RNA binding exosome subunit
MNIKNMMADFMMGNMTAEEKNAMMDQVMTKFFADIKPEDKQKMMGDMMEKFMGSMSAEEKQSMMQNMMPKMMNSIMGSGSSSPMMNMMSMMMGGKGPMNRTGDQSAAEGQNEMPWDMCKKMMSSMSKTSELATFATPEVRQLFEEWSAQIEEEIMNYIRVSKTNETEKIAEHFKLSQNSVTYFLTRLATKGKINLKAQKME